MADNTDSDSTVTYMLTTVDNPFDPFTQFDAWFTWDVSHGYHTAAFLARVVKSSDELSDADQDSAVQTAIREICQENVSGVHRMVSQSNATARE
jgi:hypothetical protein